MKGLLDTALANPWATLDTLVDGPLHPGGVEATANLLDRAEVGPETRLLDVGCGAGEALTVARERGADVLGIDHRPETQRAVRGDARAVPVAADSVDVVLTECVLCLTDLDVALAEANRVLRNGGRLALSDMVVDGPKPAVSDQVAEALCLTGARSRERLRERLETAGFDILDQRDHHDDLVAMGERATNHVDYEALLGTMGDRGERFRDDIDTLVTAVEAGRVSYVSIVATA